MYQVFKENGTPLPRDFDLVDYGFNLEDESVFHDDDDQEQEEGYGDEGDQDGEIDDEDADML